MILYDLRDLVKVYGNNTGLARALKVHPATIGRWGDTVPDSSQIKVWRLLDSDPSMRRRHNRIRATRLEQENSNANAR